MTQIEPMNDGQPREETFDLGGPASAPKPEAPRTFAFDPGIVPDADLVMKRYRAWWNNDCLDRPVVHLECNRLRPTAPLLRVPDVERDWLARQTDVEYRIVTIENRLRTKRFFGDTIPSIASGMNVTYAALLAGAKINYADHDWIEASVTDWTQAPEPRFDPAHPLIAKMVATCEAVAANARGRYLIQTPAYIDCITTMSQMRGTQDFCFDLVDNPDAVVAYRDRFVAAWLQSAAFWSTFFRRLGYPGTTNWASAFSPDHYDQIQCDFCLMVSPEVFSWLIAPEMRAEAALFGGAMFHLDGAGAIAHLDALLEIPHLKVIQWVPGAGQPTTGHWLPLLQRIQKTGKALQLYAKAAEVPLYQQHLRPEGHMLQFGFDEWGLSEPQCEDLMRQINAWPRSKPGVTVLA